MNHYPSREQVQALRERYPPGTMIQLTADMQGERFRAGDIGKVTSVDDAGQIHLAWLKGGSLAIIPGVDSFREIITEPLDLNPYLDKGNLRINGYYVDACTDNGIERADTLGKIEICEGYYCRIYKTEKDLFDGAYYDDFCLAVGHEITDISRRTHKSKPFLVIHASMAQSYSQKLSEDVKWGFRKSFAQGKAYFGGRFYGYRMAGEGKVEIIPEQAEIVKQIFQMYLDGSTSRKIAQTLTRRGVLNASGNIRWDSTAIDRMLANEKYMGDALSQKTFIADVLEKKPQKNTGQLPQYYVTDNHEAIIPREMFKRVQFERARRGSLEPKGTKTKTNAGRFRPQYVLTEILLCGECGEHYRRCTWARNGKKKVVWRCINRLENGKRNCRESPTLDEGVLHDAILGFLRNLQSPRDELVQNLLEYTEESLEQKTGDSKKQKLLDMLEQKNRLLQEMLSLDIVPDEKIEQLSREYDEIQEQIDSLGDVQNGMEQENAYIRGIKEYMETADFNRYEFDDKLIRQVIEQVIVKNADTLYIRMKGGYEAEIKLPNV